ncbi:MAG: hypothetical protein QXY91_06940 [Thermoproteota archaeon]
MELEEAQKIYEVLKEEGVKYGQMITGNYKVVVDALDAAYMKEIYIYLQNHIVYINWKKLRIETRASELTCSPPWKGRGFPSRVDHRSHH